MLQNNYDNLFYTELDTTFQPVTAEVKNIDYIATVQCSNGKVDVIWTMKHTQTLLRMK